MAKKHIQEKNLKLVMYVMDLFLLYGALFLSYYFRFDQIIIYSHGLPVLGVITIFSFYLMGVYSLRPRILIWRELGVYWAALFVAGLIFSAVVYFGRVEVHGLFGRGVILGAALIFLGTGSLFRVVLFKWLQKRARNLRWLVVGSKEYIGYLHNEFSQYHTIGSLYYLSDDDLSEFDIDARTILGGLSDIETQTQRYWSGVVIAVEDSVAQKLGPSLMKIRLEGNRVFDLASFYEYLWFKVPVFYLNSSWFALSEGFGLLHNKFGLRLKRIADLFAAAVLMLLSSPIVVLAAVFIKLDSRGSALFKQVRTGEGGKDFVIYKLRTMRLDAEKDGAKWAQKNDSRITNVGKFLRTTRIDELPQLWNVIKGDMSFIGPRPERPEFNKDLEKEIPYYNLRNLLKPGVTGWAQVMYTYGASVEDSKEKLQYDLYYIKNHSLLLDWHICLKTIRVILGAKGR